MPSVQTSNAKSLNAAARALLRAHIGKPVSQGWRYAAKVAIDTICKTYGVCPTESSTALQELMSAERLAQFPHDDLFDLAQSIKFLGPEGDEIVLRLFEAAFDSEPDPGKWEQFGSAILPMTIQSSDQWNSIHYSLAEYYSKVTGDNAAVVTEIACRAWNAVVRRRECRGNGDIEILAAIDFRGARCELPQDHSHIWGRDFEHEENRILSHFEKLVREWAAGNDTVRIDAALDVIARRNRTSLVWSLLMAIGAEHPLSLGAQLEALLVEPVCLYHPDYAYAATALLASLHRVGDATTRRRLERLVIELPSGVRSRRADSWEDGEPASWVLHAQNCLLGSLQGSDIDSAEARELWHARRAADELHTNTRPYRPEITSQTLSDEELVERRGIRLEEPANKHMFRLREALKPFTVGSQPFSVPEIERQWSLTRRSEDAITRYGSDFPEMSQELWGYLVSVCNKIARHAEWPASSRRWRTVRRILLRAAGDPVPAPDQPGNKHDTCSSWGWPSPRVDAAEGLPRLVSRLGDADSDVVAAVTALSHDASGPVRFNLAGVLPVLAKKAPGVMWQLVDTFVADELQFTVLDGVVHSLDWLWASDGDKVAARLRLIDARVRERAPVDHKIHETLAHTHLFQFLRTGRLESENYISGLVANCGEARATKALLAQLHTCRVGGWMTAGDPGSSIPEIDAMRTRTWKFLFDLLSVSQSRLNAARQRWTELRSAGETDTPEMTKIQSELNRLAHVVDGVATQLYFASGAFADKQNNKEDEKLSPAALQRFWYDAASLLKLLTHEPHPHTAYELVQTLEHLLPCSPEEIFLLAADSIRTSSTAGFQFESLAVPVVVKIVQRVLADHREIFHGRNGNESTALAALLEVLDIFVEAGWPEARRLTHRLEEIYR